MLLIYLIWRTAPQGVLLCLPAAAVFAGALVTAAVLRDRRAVEVGQVLAVAAGVSLLLGLVSFYLSPVLGWLACAFLLPVAGPILGAAIWRKSRKGRIAGAGGLLGAVVYAVTAFPLLCVDAMSGGGGVMDLGVGIAILYMTAFTFGIALEGLLWTVVMVRAGAKGRKADQTQSEPD